MMGFSGISEYGISIVENKEYQLDWGDITTSYLKPKYMYTTVNPGYLPGKPEVLWQKQFDVLRDISAPIAVSIWRDWEHNFVSGQKVEKDIWTLNHSMDDKSGLKVTWALESTGKKGKVSVAKIPQGETINAGKISFTTPAVTERTEYRLVVKLIDGKKVINRDWMRIHVFPQPGALKDTVSGRNILLYDVKGVTTGLLKKAGVKHKEYDPDETVLDKSVDLLILGYNSVDMDIEDVVEKINDYVKKGGRVLIFEQPTVKRISRSIAFVTAPGHPVFKGVSQDRLYLLNGGSGQIINSSILIPLKKAYRSLLTIGGTGALGTVGKTIRIYSVMIESLNGSGSILSCYLEVSKRYGIDPEATMIVNNMISYLANMPQKKPARVGYIGKEENILKKITAEYEIAKAADAKKYDILVIGENEIDNESEVLKNSTAIKAMVKKGGTVICLYQTPKEWNNSWLPEPIEMKRFNKITRGICNASDLTFGTRRVLYDPKQRNSNGTIFSSHFILKDGTKWSKVI